MNELRAVACLIRHKAHIVRWGIKSASDYWLHSRCMYCGGTPKELDDLKSWPFINVDGRSLCIITGKLPKGKGYYNLVKSGKLYRRILARYGLTWPQVRDAK